MTGYVINGVDVQGVWKQKERELDSTLYQFLVSVLGEESASGLKIVEEKDPSELSERGESTCGLVNLTRINDIRHINEYLEAVNRHVEYGEHFVVTMETKDARKERIMNKFPTIISRPYYVLDFILKRVLPKWKPTRRLYFMITKGRNRVLSLTEGLARMVCCGFEIMDFKQIDYKMYIVGKKVREPAYDTQPTYGALIRLNRVGRGGRMFRVFKLRTMYPYSEYLQDYIYETCDLEEGGKFSNDFRMTSWGKIFRKYWIDELPMFINYFKGELKLVGVRPLSRHYFELYPNDLQEMRIKVTPGLIPPYYADMPKGMEEIQESERRYLAAYEKRPIRTDARYFFRILVNIVFKGARSG